MVKTELYIKAHVKRLGVAGIPAYVIRHGDDDAGDLIVKLSTLDGKASMFQREYNLDTSERTWVRVLEASETEVDAAIQTQCGFDPDVWVLEIEDRKGRHFLEN